MVAEVFAGLGALKSAFDIAKGLKDIDDTTRRNAAVIELQEKILSAQQSQATLLEEVSELKKEVASLKAWDAEKENYELSNIGEGVFAYAKKPSVQSAEPSHYLCANCFTNGQKSILQKHVTHVGRWTVYACARCAAEIFPNGGGHSPRPSAGSFGRGR